MWRRGLGLHVRFTVRGPPRKIGRKLAYIAVPMFALLIAGFEIESDEWITDCAVEKRSGDCSIIGVVRGTGKAGTKGSFSIAVDLQSEMVAVVGRPVPIKATIRIDKHPPVRCVGERYCLMSIADSQTLIGSLQSGNLILLDVFTAKDIFLLSMTAQGFRAGFDKIRAYRDMIR